MSKANQYAKKRFTVTDAEKYKKNLTDKQKAKWVEAANAAVSSCVATGGSEMECEISAVRQANSLFTRNSQQAEINNNPEVREADGKKITTRLRLTLAEADITDDYQMILPVDAFHSSYYGEIIITPTFCQAIITHWQEQVLGNREPFIDTLHDRGKANGWIDDLKSDENGIYARIRWTRMGEENIRESYFRYFSSDIGEVTDIGSGERVWPVLIAVALCNTPVMNTMPQAHLAETGDHSASALENSPDINSGIKADKEQKMDPKELWEAFCGMDETEKAEFIARLPLPDPSGQSVSTGGETSLEKEIDKIEETINRLQATVESFSSNTAADKEASAPKEGEQDKVKLEVKVEALEKANIQLTDYVKSLQKQEVERKREEVLSTALRLGKILPKDRSFWEEKFLRDPEGIREVLERMPERKVFGEAGTGEGGEEKEQLSEEERAVMKKLGLSEEDMQKYGDKVTFPQG